MTVPLYVLWYLNIFVALLGITARLPIKFLICSAESEGDGGKSWTARFDGGE